jgi:tRNA dimethylallyltransferase
MNAAPAEPLLVVLLGPTASGKTSLALELAERFGGEIVSCDSVSVYREVDIGSAKPNANERARAPHHLLDVASPDEHYTAGDYGRDARAAIQSVAAHGKLPIVSGGTGLYLRALIDGLFPGPQRHPELRERLRNRAETRGAAYVHRILRRLDAQAASSIHANDTPKAIRAIEVSLAAKQPMTEAWKLGRDPLTGFRILRLGLDPERAQLYRRIDARVTAMFAGGLVAETSALIAKYGDAISTLNALGYKQAQSLLRGEIDEIEAIRQTQQGHRNYAKRQMSWFRREAGVNWLRGFGDERSISDQAIAVVDEAIVRQR